MSATLVDAVEAPERAENEYAHLAPLFTERARLAADDPRRDKLLTLLVLQHGLQARLHLLVGDGGRLLALQELDDVVPEG